MKIEMTIDMKIEHISFSILSIIFASIINYFGFKLDFLYTLIYDIIIISMIYLYLYQNDDIEYGTNKEKVSFLLIIESLLLSFKKYTFIDYSYEWHYLIIPKIKNETKEIDLFPDMLSLLVSIFFYLSLRIRNGIFYDSSIKTCAFSVAYVLYFSSIISVLASNEYIKIPLYGETKVTTKSFCVYTLVLSYVGIKSMNKILIPASLFFILGRIDDVNRAMGKNGIFYIMFAFVSMSLQVESFKKILNEIKEDFEYKKSNIYITNINNNINVQNVYDQQKKKINEKANIKKEQMKFFNNPNYSNYNEQNNFNYDHINNYFNNAQKNNSNGNKVKKL